VTQAFFARLLEKDYLQAVRRELGPFRAFLQMAFRSFLSKERDRASALQRGAGAAHVPFDLTEAESSYAGDAPKAALSAPKDGPRYAEMAAAIQSSEGAVRVAAHRLRRRFRELFRLEVAQTESFR
jgi:RNA polymerase sigma-70 factor (ECF subfamily)